MTGLFDRLRTALVDLGMGRRRVTDPGAADAAEAQLPAGSLTWLTEQLADRYVITGQIGTGGMALVFRANDIKHQRNVAVKIMRPELTSQVGRERFLREIQLVAHLSHPHILPLYDSGEVAGLLYFVMPCVEGGSLRDELREGPLPVEKATGIARAVATALDYAHRHEIVHRDIKPENIMLQEGVAMVTDFGIGKVLRAESDEQLTQTGTAIGTAAYMSPEQIHGAELDGRSDIYSLACVLYEMVTGTPLFTGPTLQALLARRIAMPMPEFDYPETVPHSIRTAIRTALAEAPADRPGTGAQFADALTREVATPPPTTPVTRVAASSEKSIAVLPFANMSPDPEAEYFSDGITEEIINALAQLPDLRVAARTSCFAFKGMSPDLAEIREKLKVGVVLEGSVRKVGDRLRITAQLVSAADGFHIWSERYDRELTDVFALQDELTAAIVTQLGAHLGLSGALPKRARPENLAAYDLYLRGKFHSNRFKDYQKAVKCYEQATEADPGYAAAYAALADAHAWFAYIEGGKPSDIYPKAKTAALRALELDAGLAEAHSALGHIRFAYDWDWAGAEDEFKRAITLNPNSAAAHHQYSIYLGNVGRLEEAIAIGEQTVRLDPLSVAASQALGLLFVLAQQYDEGRIHLERALDLDPNFPVARVCLAVLYVKTQMPEKAIEECARAVSASGGAAGPQAMLGYTYAVAHRTEEARSVLATLENLAQNQYVSAAYIAFPYIGLGEHDEAFRWLDTAFAERAGALTWLPTWPVYDSLREDPRFSRLLQRMGLEG